MSINSKWNKLTEYLKKINKEEILLSDCKMKQITGSTDRRKVLPLSDNKCCIQQRAENAGYLVNFHIDDDHIKVFSKFKIREGRK